MANDTPPRPTADPTGGELIRRFNRDEASRGLADSSVAKYTEIVRTFSEHVNGDLLEVTTEQVVLWLHDRTHQLSPRTRHVYLTALHAFYTWATVEDLIAYPPTARIVRPLARTSGAPLDLGTLADAAVFRDYRRSQERRDLSKRTIDGHRNQLASFACWMQPRSVLDASAEDVETWLDSLKIQPRSRSAYLCNLSVFYTWAKRAGHVSENVAAEIPRPRKERLVPRPIGVDDLVRAMRQAPPRMAAWLALASYMGLRCKEIAGLRRDDLLLDRDNPTLIVSAPKGRRERVLPMNVHAETALRRYGMPTQGPVFVSSRGGPFAPATVSGYIAGYLHGLGIAATAHQGRHLFGTTIYNVTGDIRVAQEMLGHADCSTTAIYVAMNNAVAAKAMRTMTYASVQ